MQYGALMFVRNFGLTVNISLFPEANYSQFLLYVFVIFLLKYFGYISMKKLKLNSPSQYILI